MRVCIMLVQLLIASLGGGLTKTEEFASKFNCDGQVAIYGLQWPGPVSNRPNLLLH